MPQLRDRGGRCFRLLCCLAVVSIVLEAVQAKVVSIRNAARHDTAGNLLNAHDGGIFLMDDADSHPTYYLLGTRYAECSQKGVVCDGVCGYLNNTLAMYSSPDLVQWTLLAENVLPALLKDNDRVPYWMANVYKHPQSRLYVMLYRNNGPGLAANAVTLATAKRPEGPYTPCLLYTSPSPRD